MYILISILTILNRIFSYYRIILQMFLYYGKKDFLLDGFISANRTIAFTRRVAVDGSLETLILTYYRTSSDSKKFAGKFLILITGVLCSLSLIVSLCSGAIGKISGIPINLLKSYTWFLMYLSPIIPMMFLISFMNGIMTANNRVSIPYIAICVGNLFNLLMFKLHLANGLDLLLGSLLYSLIPVLILGYMMRNYVSLPDNLWLSPEEKAFLSSGLKSTLVQNFSGLADYYSYIKAAQLGSGAISSFEFAHKIIFFLYSVIAMPISNIFTAKPKHIWRSFMLIHTLGIFPCILLIYNTYLLPTGYISDVVANSSIYLYFMMQVKLFKTLLLVHKEVSIVTWSGVAFAVINGLGVYIYHGSLIEITWSCNIATGVQFFILFFYAIKKKLFSIKGWGPLIWPPIVSIGFSIVLKWIPNIYMLAVVTPLYILVNYHYTKYLFV